jgi:hypothetical protein
VVAAVDERVGLPLLKPSRRAEMANEKHLKLQGVRAWNAWREANPGVEPDLRGANLRDADLRGANLRDADLRGANLRDADLRGAVLGGAALNGANLSGAVLIGANLNGANLIGAVLKKALWLNDFMVEGGPPEPPLIRDARFTVYHPKEIAPEQWRTLLIYAHVSEMQEWVYKDAQVRLGQPESYGQRSDRATQDIPKGAEIVIIPELPGCQFNPPVDRFWWFEDVHRREFRFRPTPEVPGFTPGTAVNGRVSFYIASILIAEVAIWAFISDQADGATDAHGGSSPRSAPLMSLTAPSGVASVPSGTSGQHNMITATPYSAIFVSYAHEDGAVVGRLGAAYKALGMTFLRDQEVLRSGERWNPRLLALIEQADLFQLCWSQAARQSHHVGQEWRHALQQNRDNFIRPVYWQKPMPEPPEELSDIHFCYLSSDA